MTAKHRLISPTELAGVLSKEASCVLLDVRSKNAYGSCHLPDAVNNCVFEVGFEERMGSLVSDFACPIYVYGDSRDTHEARMAAEKLARAGYTGVFELREGIDGWNRAGLSVEESSEPATPTSPDLEGTREINLDESRIEWFGRNLLNRHHGSLAFKNGVLEFKDSRLIGGTFVLDMQTIACKNLQDDPLHDVLVNHLRSHDFFDCDVYPEACFRMTSVEPLNGVTRGSADMRITGELTLKEITRSMTFDAASGFTTEGHFAAQAIIAFDRTLWNVLYGSGKYFRNLGMHLVNDLIEVHVRMLAQ